MNKKNVCQLDSDGYFDGFSLAFESPLEPGVFLIPAGCVDIAPPVVLPGKRYKFKDGFWKEEPASVDPGKPKDPSALGWQARRAIAYADPLNGSDRLFVEAQRMQIMGEEGWEDVIAAAITRHNEIKSQIPMED